MIAKEITTVMERAPPIRTEVETFICIPESSIANPIGLFGGSEWNRWRMEFRLTNYDRVFHVTYEIKLPASTE